MHRKAKVMLILQQIHWGMTRKYDNNPGEKTITLDAALVICDVTLQEINILGPGQNTSKPSGDVEETPVTRSELRLFKETIQLKLDGAVNAINEVANTVKVHFEGKSLGLQIWNSNFRDAHPGCDRSLKAIFNAWVVHYNYLRQVYAKQQMVACKEQARISNLVSGYMNEQGCESPLAGIRSLHRHQESTITATLCMLDVLHLWVRYQQQWTATTGAWPHLRMPSSQLSNREPPLGLPKNFYAQDYLSSLTSEGLDNLLLQEDIHLDIPWTIAVQTALGSTGRYPQEPVHRA
ncbi:hypothetical protein EDC04DRAFT_2613293 [Pisolithus marmoratus]|nr:hypothetical protein EDC04DRAFT_2613293 [Pisolithus marmoratus]